MNGNRTAACDRPRMRRRKSSTGHRDVSHLYDRTANAVRAIYERRIDTPPTLAAEHYFPNGEKFAQSWTDIRDEALAIACEIANVPRFHDIMPAQADISANDGRDWRIFIMKVYGVTVEENLRRCPTVAALLADARDVVSCVFSFLAPGKHVPKHRGPFRGILRYHLMLSVPRDANGNPTCQLDVDGVPYHLVDGEHLLWDDTYPHEAWNRSDQVRIAMLLDVWRRDQPMDVALLSNAIYAGAQLAVRMRGASYAG